MPDVMSLFSETAVDMLVGSVSGLRPWVQALAIFQAFTALFVGAIALKLWYK